MTLVSVVMPTHNSSGWVAETIANLGRQTYANIELIVVDDGSTDETRSLVNKTLSSGFRHDWTLIPLNRNCGPSAARNVGLAAAKGAWVQFIDSDDLIAPTKIERQMAHCTRAADDVVGVYSPWRQFQAEGGRITLIGSLSRPQMMGRSPIMCLVGNDRPLHPAGLARRTALTEVGGFDETLRFWEFEEATFRLAKVGRLETLDSNDPAYLWRQHPDKRYVGGRDARYLTSDVALGWIRLMVKCLDGRSLADSDIPHADQRNVLGYCAHWGRLLFRQDRPSYREYLSLAQRLKTAFNPFYPAALSSRAFEVILGDELMGSFASLGWALADRFRGHLRRLRPHEGDAGFDWSDNAAC